MQVTQQNLSQHFELRNTIQRDLAVLKAIENANQGDCFSLAAEIADMRKNIAAKQAELEQGEVEIRNFIQSIPDNYLRALFMLRYLSGLTWNEIAVKMGGQNTASAVKKMCYRYLAK